jgi:hypothetical protein
MFRAGPVARNDNRPRLDRASWQAKAGILALAAGTGLVIFITLPERGSFSLTVGLAAALLAIVYFLARDLLGGTHGAGTAAAQSSQIAFVTRLRGSARQTRVAARAEPGAQSAAGFLARFRRSLEVAESEAEEAAKEFGVRGFARLRFATGSAENDGNDLRHYLNKRLAASQAEARNAIMPKHDGGAHVLKSLDAAPAQILQARQDAGSRALLVGGAAAIDATAEAISIARAFVAAGHQVVLLDLAHGPHSICAALGLPRFPGLSDLAAGRAQFEDVIGLDAETPLHVIAAGNPRFAADGNGRFAAILAALTEAYDSVVLHADREALRRTAPDLRVALSIAVAVCPQGAGGTADLSGFTALGCRTIAYEQGASDVPGSSAGPQRSRGARALSRAAASSE